MPFERPLPLSRLTASNPGEKSAWETGAEQMEDCDAHVPDDDRGIFCGRDDETEVLLQSCTHPHSESPGCCSSTTLECSRRDGTKPHFGRPGAPGGTQWH